MVTQIARATRQVTIPGRAMILVERSGKCERLYVMLRRFLVLAFVIRLVHLILTRTVRDLVVTYQLRCLACYVSFHAFRFRQDGNPPIEIFDRGLLTINVHRTCLAHYLKRGNAWFQYLSDRFVTLLFSLGINLVLLESRGRALLL